jgi:hypothetical protein
MSCGDDANIVEKSREALKFLEDEDGEKAVRILRSGGGSIGIIRQFYDTNCRIIFEVWRGVYWYYTAILWHKIIMSEMPNVNLAVKLLRSSICKILRCICM